MKVKAGAERSDLAEKQENNQNAPKNNWTTKDIVILVVFAVVLLIIILGLLTYPSGGSSGMDSSIRPSKSDNTIDNWGKDEKQCDR